MSTRMKPARSGHTASVTLALWEPDWVDLEILAFSTPETTIHPSSQSLEFIIIMGVAAVIFFVNWLCYWSLLGMQHIPTSEA